MFNKSIRIANEMKRIAKCLVSGDENRSIRNLNEHKHSLGENSNPAVYVGTYAKYNNGNLGGEWIDLTTFDDHEDFREWCEKELHGDESDPELMLQDYEGFPSKYYDEWDLSKELWDEYLPAIKKHGKNIVDAVLDNGNSISDLENAGWIYPGCHTVKDVVFDLLHDGGLDAFSDKQLEYWFDYAECGKLVDEDGYNEDEDEDEDKDEEGKNLTYDEIGEEFVNSIYGSLDKLIDQARLGDSVARSLLMDCVDFDGIGRDLNIEMSFIPYDEGMIVLSY